MNMFSSPVNKRRLALCAEGGAEFAKEIGVGTACAMATETIRREFVDRVS
jgi:hypothetical protein